MIRFAIIVQSFNEKIFEMALIVVSVSASHAVDHGFPPLLGHTKDHTNGTTASLLDTQALG